MKSARCIIWLRAIRPGFSRYGRRIADPKTVLAAIEVIFSAEALRVVLDDGREHLVPLAWLPWLLAGTLEQRQGWTRIGNGEDLH